MRDHLTIHLNVDRRLLVILGVALAAFVLFDSSNSAQGNAATLTGSSNSAYLGTIRTAPEGLASASSMSGARRFYLTSTQYPGDQPLTSCTTGFHMASIWEILDVSNLRYTSEFGAWVSDAGDGPPSDVFGWVRTGYGSSSSTIAGHGNCFVWDTDSASYSGTAAELTPNWETPPDPVGLWSFESDTCNTNNRVWCVED